MTKSLKIDLTDLFERGRNLLNEGHDFRSVIGAIEKIARKRLHPTTPRKDGVKKTIEAEERLWFLGMEFREWLEKCEIVAVPKKGV